MSAARLTAIRELLRCGRQPLSALAKRFGVSRQVLSRDVAQLRRQGLAVVAVGDAASRHYELLGGHNDGPIGGGKA
jgi:predicted DNA-binding transcriptional regulator YafY